MAAVRADPDPLPAFLAISRARKSRHLVGTLGDAVSEVCGVSTATSSLGALQFRPLTGTFHDFGQQPVRQPTAAGIAISANGLGGPQRSAGQIHRLASSLLAG